MNVKDIQKEVQQLSNIDDVLVNFTQQWIIPVKKHLPDKELKKELMAFRQAVEQAKQGQQITEKLKTLAHYLVTLRLASVTNDQKMRSIALQRFLHDPFIQLKMVIDDLQHYEETVHELQNHYRYIHETVAEALPLEHKVSLLDSSQQFTFQNLSVTVKKQKHFLKQIGQEFLKEVMKMRESTSSQAKTRSLN